MAIEYCDKVRITAGSIGNTTKSNPPLMPPWPMEWEGERVGRMHRGAGGRFNTLSYEEHIINTTTKHRSGVSMQCHPFLPTWRVCRPKPHTTKEQKVGRGESRETRTAQLQSRTDFTKTCASFLKLLVPRPVCVR